MQQEMSNKVNCERGIRIKVLTNKEILYTLKKLGIYSASELESCIREYRLFYVYTRN